MFNELTIAYLFLGGTGGGALVVMGLLELVNRRHYAQRRTARAFESSVASSWPSVSVPRLVAPHELLLFGWTATLIVLSMASVCLLLDVGRPDRVLSLFLAPAASPVSLGAWTLLAATACAALWAIFSVMRGRFIPAWAVIALALFTMICGFVAIGYTGVLLQMLASVLAYQTLLITVLFVLSSLSCGISLVCGCASFVGSRQTPVYLVGALLNADRILIILEAVAVAAYLIWLASSPALTPFLDALFEGDLSSSFWVCFMLLGLAAPFVIESAINLNHYRQIALWVGFFVLLGGYTLRYWITGLADFDATQMPEAFFGLTLGATAALGL